MVKQTLDKVTFKLKEPHDLSFLSKHENLIELIEHYSAGNLYVAVFKWAKGECLFDPWNFDEYLRNYKIISPKERFEQLSVEKRINSINVMFKFLVHAEAKGYAAVDFYDGRILRRFAA